MAPASDAAAQSFDDYLDRAVDPKGGLTNTTSSGMMGDTIRKRASHFRERWQTIPFSTRMMVLTLVVFSFVAVLLAALVEGETERSMREFHHQPKMLSLVADVMVKLVDEDRATHKFLSGMNDEREMLAVRNEVDASVAVALSFFETHHPYVHVVVAGNRADPTLGSELLLEDLFELRQRVYPKPLLPSSSSSTIFTEILAHVATFYLRLAVKLNERFSVNEALSMWFAGSVGLGALERAHAAEEFFSLPPFADAQTRAEKLLSLLRHETTMDFFEHTVLGAVVGYAESNALHLAVSSAQVNTVFQRLDHSGHHWLQPGTPTMTAATWGATVANKSWAQFEDTMSDLKSFQASVGVPRAYRYNIEIFVLLGIVCFAVAVCGAYTVVQRLTDTRYVAELHAAHVMREAIVRVTEYSYAMETFDLNPPPAPEGMMGTETGEMEVRLQRCLASLRALAPTLPAKLLPFRNGETLKSVEAVRQIERGQSTIQRVERSFVKTSSLQVMNSEDLDGRKSLSTMSDLTKLQVKPTFAHCLTIDLSEIHRAMGAQKGVLEHISLVYPRILEQFEEAVLHHGGVLHVVWKDHAVAVWEGTDTPQHEVVLNVAQAANSVVAKLNHLRRLTPEKLPTFRVHLAITAGQVFLGVFGNDQHKTLQIFGESIARGQQYALVNAHHSTAIVCDETVKDSLENVFPCKPIELLPAFGEDKESSTSGMGNTSYGEEQSVVYEVITGQARKEDDLATRLATYKRAFDLFAQRYYREALKAFRGYTKQYGYDRSVERIQSVMTGED